MSIRTSLENKLYEISLVLEKKYKFNKDIGVLEGLSGIAMFFFYYSKQIQDDRYSEVGNNIIWEIIEKIEIQKTKSI